jgi:hypothetical protein
MTVCLQLFDEDNCESDVLAGTLGLAANTARRLNQKLDLAQAQAIKQAPVSADIDRALIAAQIDAIRVGQYLRRLNVAPGNATLRHRELTATAVQRCIESIAKARAPSAKSKSADLARAGRHCRNARSLLDSLGWREHAGQQEKVLRRSAPAQ